MVLGISVLKLSFSLSLCKIFLGFKFTLPKQLSELIDLYLPYNHQRKSGFMMILSGIVLVNSLNSLMTNIPII